MLTGDHGQAFYEHGFASHASAIFDEVMKVPLVIRAPQLKPGTEDRLAQHVDIAPSIVGLLGLPAHPSFQGIDLLNTAPDPKRSAYMVAQTPLGKESPEQARKAGRMGLDVTRELADGNK